MQLPNVDARASRRAFLAAAGAGTLAFAPPALFAAGRKLPALQFTVVSDTHLGYRHPRAWHTKGTPAHRWDDRLGCQLGHGSAKGVWQRLQSFAV